MVTLSERLRSLLRRFGIGERRWIPDPEARERHAETVLERLPEGPIADTPPTGKEPTTGLQQPD
jgi:hypothetical protein